jgi:acyl phosphate:glycerol-3-phosphate acyltransferase
MDFVFISFSVVLASYLVGSIPFGVIIVRLFTGKDVRNIESGRTGGTNVMRAAGFWPGLATALLDILKSAASVWLAKSISPGNAWLHVIAPLAAIMGHNYSVFLVERLENGKFRFRGGAGGAACVGGSMGFWPFSFLFIVPIGALIVYFVGYASVATMSVALISTLVFAIRAGLGLSPWEYSVYGLVSFFLLAWSLRPNIQRLINGTERIVGFRARQRKQ